MESTQRSEAPVVATTSASAAATVASPATITVLMIDDAKTIVEYVRSALEQTGGFRVVCAYDGEEGLERFYAERPDCVIVDIMMPRMDGYQFVRCLRADASARQMPLIMATALATPSHEQIGYLSGADLYITKPYRPNQLLDAIRRVMALTPEERERRMEILAQGGEHPDAHL
ncbi:MAG TPA: response regulator [Ktedonobacterales bacterium]|nr:response regulator [Ktedonobacterales bacterium]